MQAYRNLTFFLDGYETLTLGIEAYFARKMAADPDFRDTFSIPGLQWGDLPPGGPSLAQTALRASWADLRLAFLRFYGLRASGNFSLGSHDEWNIFRALNANRLKKSRQPGQLDGDVSELLAGFFDGAQIVPGATAVPVSRGYSI